MVDLVGSIVVLGGWIATLLLLFQKRRSLFHVFFLWLFVWTGRTLSMAYLTGSEPVFAEELSGVLEGRGGVPFLLALLVTLLPMWMIWAPWKCRESLTPIESVDSPPWFWPIRSLLLILVGFIVLGAYAEMLATGSIPLLKGMERWEYMSDSGPFSSLLFKYSGLFAFVLGMFSMYDYLDRGKFFSSGAAIYGAFVGFAVLTGHRFSIFLSSLSYFLIPYVVVAFRRVRQGGSKVRPAKTPRSTGVLWASAAFLTFSGAVGFLIYNSFFAVRAGGEIPPLFKLFQRILVQPGQMWVGTYERVFGGGWMPGYNWRFVFLDPIDPTRNTLIQLLMVHDIGMAQATDLITKGQQYAGGYPEVAFELFGPVFGWFMLAGSGLLAAAMLKAICVRLARRRILSAIFIAYLFYTFSVLFVGGMIDFIVAWSFWAKVATVFLAIRAEAYLDASQMTQEVD